MNILDPLLTWPADRHGDYDDKEEEDEDGEGDGDVAATVVEAELLGVEAEDRGVVPPRGQLHLLLVALLHHHSSAQHHRLLNNDDN